MARGNPGQDRKPWDWSKLDAILQYGAKLLDASDIMGVSIDTIERKIRKEYDMTYAEYRDKKMSKMRVGLSRKQIEVAMNGNVTMLIWLGKQYLGQTDKIENEIKSEGFNLIFDKDKLSERSKNTAS